jgi:hypothetical protein
MKDFRNLKVWEKSHSLTLALYKASGPISPARTFWVDQPDASMQRIYWRKYCRRLWQAGK